MKYLNMFLPLLSVLALASCQKAEWGEVKLIPAENFQKEIDGKAVNLYTLKNDNGMVMQVTNYGTRIVSLWVPDKEGNFRDVVLGRNTIDEYLASEEKYYGATVGRYANRIAKGQFTLTLPVHDEINSPHVLSLEEKTYRLNVNDGENHLHGGSKGFFDVVWDAAPYTTVRGEDAIRFTYRSADGEMGYPGNLDVEVKMVLDGVNNEVRIYYEAKTDAPTVVNLSHHSYFNLTGEGSETITDHVLLVNASYYTPTDAKLIPTGEIAPVEGTPLDFRKLQTVGDRIGNDFEALKLGGGYDHNWVLDSRGSVGVAAEIYSPVSGIAMAVYTDEPGIQFYSGNFMSGNDIGKRGKPYGYRSAFCLETQKFPDSPNRPDFPSTVLLPGQRYSTVCYYYFDLAKAVTD